jgi:hypothetical protein
MPEGTLNQHAPLLLALLPHSKGACFIYLDLKQVAILSRASSVTFQDLISSTAHR